MTRIINADELIEQEKVFAEKYKGDFGEQVATHVIEILTNAPTADDWQKYSDALWKKAYERGKNDAVRHGRWFLGTVPYAVCSECKNRTPLRWDERCGYVLDYRSPYCPYCGAKMDAERREE